MNMDQALQTFLVESRELLAEMESGLLALEQAAGDGEAVNALFRSVHTIKGSAGLFGLDHVVAFTHVVENVLDRLRACDLEVTGELVALLLECCDHTAALLNHVEIGGDADRDTALAGAERSLLERLDPYCGRESTRAGAGAAMPVPAGGDGRAPGAARCVASDNWHISVRFGREVLRDGMDPLSFLRYLGTIGRIVNLTTLTDALPEAADMDPECCYLGLEIDFESDADKETIAGVFEFIRESSLVRILPPRGKLAEYMDLIASLPEEDARLGELLVASGALTRAELEEGLRLQQQAAGDQQFEREAAGRRVRLGEILVGEGLAQRETVASALDKQERVREQKRREARYVRVQADKLDALINLIGELVIAGASTTLIARRSGDAAMQEAAAGISRLVEEIRDGALSLRMVEIGETFARFQRVVRDVSRELGKDIELVVSGADTELDKTVVERIADPLMHLVRNAVDHGIEPPCVREQRGKPAKGTVRLNAYHDSGSIVIEVADDGGGLNRARILEQARARGLVTDGQALSDEEVYALVFEPGFSTAAEVSNLSGRGVGMDVVKRNITALRGGVEIKSAEGVGTTVVIRLPLTLAIIDGFLVRVGAAHYVVPLDAVVECLELDEARRAATRGRNYVNLRGEVLPFLRLREQFAVAGEPARRENIVVVQYAGTKVGLLVDELLGELQTVIKPLGRLFGALQGIGGSSILGSGEVALILDVPALVQRVVAAEAGAACQDRSAA